MGAAGRTKNVLEAAETIVKGRVAPGEVDIEVELLLTEDRSRSGWAGAREPA